MRDMAGLIWYPSFTTMTKPIFPPASKDYVLGFQFSSWYPSFVKYTIKSTIVRPLPDDFCEYLDADGIFVPEGSENMLHIPFSFPIILN